MMKKKDPVTDQTVSVQLCGRLFLQRTVGYPQSMDRHPALHPAYAVCIFYHQLPATLHRYRFFQPLWTAYHSDRSFSKRTGTDHRDLLSKDQDQLRCDLPAHHSDPDFLILRPDQGSGHRNHHGGIYHGKKHRHDRKYLRQTFPFCYGQRLKKGLTFITLVAIIALNQ